MPNKPLPSVFDLIRDSWKLYTTTWNESVKLSMWFLYFGLVDFLISLITKFSPLAGNIIEIPLSLIIAIVAYWVAIRLIRGMLKLEAGGKIDMSKEESRRAWNLFFPNLWVGLLQVLIILGASLLLIIPGIYFMIALSFAQIILIDQNIRGFAAISASHELVKGRWWETAWMVVGTGFILGLIVALATSILMSIVMLVAGVTTIGANSDPLFIGTTDLLTAIVQAAVLPLFIGLQIKIYRALQGTKAPAADDRR